MLPGVQLKTLTSHDGTTLCYYTRGKGPAVVLANGLGGPLTTYRHILEQLGQDLELDAFLRQVVGYEPAACRQSVS